MVNLPTHGRKPSTHCSRYQHYLPMNKPGPIIIIEDDDDDQKLLDIVFSELAFKNEIIFFSDSEKALDFLIQSAIEPFIILSDINMPRLSGIQLREKINTNEDLRIKCIPYLFFSTSAEQQHVVDAYSKSVQGFFVKPDSYEKLKRTIKIIVNYWQECESPNYIR
jgi:CheY-like chemotaxis protein